MSKKTIVFTFGRFQPPTTGHGKLFNAVISHAKSVGGEHRIYASQSFDGGRPRAAVKNPLQYNDKIRFLKQMFPQANIVKSGAGINTFMDVLYDLEKRGYKKIHMIVGEDRVEDIQKTVDKYLNTGGENVLNLEEFKVVSAGHRDPEATGVEGMSASKLRAAVAANDFKLFKTGMPTGFSGARELFDAIAKGLAKPMKKSKKTINEKAPPDEKAERMISKAKESFQDRYGDNADSYLYGVAWKQYNKRHGIKTKTRLGEPIMEGAYQHSKGQLKQAIDGSETLIATLKRYLKTAKSAALKAEIENQIEFWKKNIADARVELGESIMEGAVKSSMEDWLYDLPKAVISEIKKKYGKILAAANKPPYKTVFSADVKDGIGKILMANKVKPLMGSHKESVGAITMSFDTYHGAVNEEVELDEASNTIPDSAIVVTQNLQKKTITFTWYDGNTEKWIEREVPQDEAPGFYTRAGTAMKTRKTDKYGNLLKAPLPDSTAKFEKLAKANEAIAADLIALFSKKPMGTPITIYGTKPNKKDEYELEIVKRMYQGDEAYTVKSSGRFVELRKSPTGLQIVDVKTKRIVLDKGNDATW